jgi:hypothetical protein
MNEIFFVDPSEPPVPPNEVRIQSVDMIPLNDGRRVRVRVELSPFEQSPNLELEVYNQAGEKVADFSAIGVIENKMEFTLHLRNRVLCGKYSAKIKIFYSNIAEFLGRENQQVNSTSELFDLTTKVVDTITTSFEITKTT